MNVSNKIWKEEQKRMDYEANVFAVLLLMPKEILLKEIKKMKGLDLTNDKNFKTLCKKFEVTATALAFRLSLLEQKEYAGLR